MVKQSFEKVGKAVAAVSTAATTALVSMSAHAIGADPSSYNANDPLTAFGGTTGSQFAEDAGLGSNTDLPSTIASIIRLGMSFLGIVAVLIILYGGFRWMTSGGDPEKIKGARNMMIAGVVGIVIILAAYSIATYVLGTIQNTVLTP